MIEGAIVMPVAIILMAGSVEFGQLFSAYGTAEKSMRDAARYLARVQPDQVCSWGLDKAKNLAVYGSVTNTGQPLIPGWTTATVNAYWMPANVDVSSCPTPSSIIEMRADVPYTGFMFSTIGLSNIWTLHVKHQERSIGG
jgi:TadE-like protein